MMPSVSLVLTESERPRTELAFWEWELQVFFSRENLAVRSFFSTVTKKNGIRRL